MRTKVLLLLLTLLCCRAAFAHNEVALRVSSSFLLGGELYATSPRSNLISAELTYARELLALGQGQLWIEGGLSIGSTRAPLFATQGSELSGTFGQLSVGARYTLPLWRVLVPQLRAGLGLALGSLALDDEAGARLRSKTAAGLSGYALAGLQLLVPRPWMRERGERGLTVGLTIEGGLVFSTPLAFQLRPRQDGELLQIPTRGVGLGSLGLTGGALRVGALLRF